MCACALVTILTSDTDVPLLLNSFSGDIKRKLWMRDPFSVYVVPILEIYIKTWLCFTHGQEVTQAQFLMAS